MYAGSRYSYRSGIPKQFYHLKDHEFEEWEIPPWELLIYKNQQLGQGNFGEVYKARWRGTPVVAKVAHDPFSEKQKMLLIREFEALTKIHHPHIVQLLGYVKNPFVIVMECLTNGNLKDYIKHNNCTITQKKQMCVDILRALAYLHMRNPFYIIHRDIKMTNILVNSIGKIKLGDFGLSTLLRKKQNSVELSQQMLETQSNTDDLTADVGTKRYMAPEMQSGHYSYKIDIWSAGILFGEIFGESIPTQIEAIIKNKMVVPNSKERIDCNVLIDEFESIEDAVKSRSCLCFL
jgi:serine/threonine protein kinase